MGVEKGSVMHFKGKPAKWRSNILDHISARHYSLFLLMYIIILQIGSYALRIESIFLFLLASRLFFRRLVSCVLSYANASTPWRIIKRII